MEIRELDVVLTRSGRKGAIVHVYGGGEAYEIEYQDALGDTETIKPEDVVEVLSRTL